MSVEAAKWLGALVALGFDTFTVAGEGRADQILPGLAMHAAEAPPAGEVADALAPADLVVVENLCSLPLNPPAMGVVAGALRGRPAVLRHHDLAWQRCHLAHLGPPPTDPTWAHVTVNDLSRRQLAAWGIRATTVRNRFDTSVSPASSAAAQAVRRSLGVETGQRLVIQPTRAIGRKNIPAGLALAEALGATYWLSGPAEEGYGPTLATLLADARCPVRQGPIEDPAGAYAAADVVVLPSTWEGFGNPAVEAAIHRRPLAIGSYPVAAELEAFGFWWFPAGRPSVLANWLDRNDPAEPHPGEAHSGEAHPAPAETHLGEAHPAPAGLAAHNLDAARRHFSLADLPATLARVMDAAGWSTW